MLTLSLSVGTGQEPPTMAEAPTPSHTDPLEGSLWSVDSW